MSQNDTSKAQQPSAAEVARKRRHIKLLEKLKGGHTLSAAETRELTSLEAAAEAERGGGSIVRTRHEVAAHCGVHERTIAKWRKDPSFPTMPSGAYDLELIAGWLEARERNRKAKRGKVADANGTNYEAELRKWKAKREELKYETESGALIPRADVHRAWRAHVNEARALLLNLPSSLALLVPPDDRPRFVEEARIKVDDALKTLAGMDTEPENTDAE